MEEDKGFGPTMANSERKAGITEVENL